MKPSHLILIAGLLICLMVFVPVSALDPQISCNSMTSNTTSSACSAGYYVNISQSIDVSLYNGWKAFDSTAGFWAASNTSTQWVHQQIPVSKALTSYSIKGYSDPIFAPNTWKLYGSTDKTSWVELDSQSGITWAGGDTKSYTVSNIVGYNYYNITVTSNNGGVNTVIDEIIFYGTDPVTPPVASFTTTGAGINSVYPSYVTFTDTSTNSPTTTNMSFGDGTWSNGTAHSWTRFYNVAGYYSPRLICNNTNTTGVGDYTATAAIQLETDFDNNVTSWVHFNGVDGSTTIIGEAGLAWTSAGGAALSTTQKKFGTASLGLQSNDARIFTSGDTSLNIGVGNATIEFWIYPTAPGISPIVKRSTGDKGITDGWGLYNTNGASNGYVVWTGSQVANSSSAFTISDNAWSHVAITFNNTPTNRGYQVYVNGIQVTNKLSPGPYDVAAVGLMIGSKGVGVEWQGYIDEFRYSVGNARWTKYPTPYNTPYAEYFGNLTITDTNLESTIGFKTIPPAEAYVANQTNGGFRTRTLQVRNLTNARYVTGSTSYDSDAMFTQNSWIRTNNSYYPMGLSIVSSSVDPVAGLIYFNVSKDGAGFNAGTDRASFIDMDMLYVNYENPATEEQETQYFGVVHNINATDARSYPFHFFVATNLTYGDWNFVTDLKSTTTVAQVGVPITFSAPWVGAFPNMWNWSMGGTWINGTTTNTTSYSFTSAGPKDISVVAAMSQNTSISSLKTYAAMVSITGSELQIVPKPKSINYGIPGNVTVQINNISHAEYVLTNITYNKTILQVTDIFPAQVGDLSVALYNNVAGYASINLSVTDASYTSMTDIAYIQFNQTLSTISNATEPLNIVQQTGVVINSSYAGAGLYMFGTNKSGEIEPTNDVLTQTIKFINSGSLEQITGVLVTSNWSGGATGSATTTSGEITISSTWGYINITSVAPSFYDSTVYNIEITGGETIIYLTPFTGTAQNTVFYQPFQVRLRIVDGYGVPLPDSVVKLSYLSSSLPSTDISWLTSAYGLRSSVAQQMVDSAEFMQDSTGGDGSVSFTAFAGLRYNAVVTNTTIGLNHAVIITPKDSDYTIYCPLSGQVQGNNTMAAIVNTSLPYYVVNTTAYTVGLIYQDTSGCTSDVLFNVSYRNGTTVYSHNNIGFGPSIVVDNYTIIRTGRGTEVTWKYNATKVC
jgi:hypothetical protein